jgi:hypothetical protein
VSLLDERRAILGCALNFAALIAIAFSDNPTVQIAGAAVLPVAGYLFFSGVGARHDPPP